MNETLTRMIIPEAPLSQINSSRDLRVREDQIFQPTTLRLDQTETTSALTVEDQLRKTSTICTGRLTSNIKDVLHGNYTKGKSL